MSIIKFFFLLRRSPVFPRTTVVALCFVALMSASSFCAETRRATSNVYRLRMRARPSSTAKIVGYLAKGDSVSVIHQSTFSTKVAEVTDSWYEVQTSSGLRGWVFGYYLDIAHPAR